MNIILGILFFNILLNVECFRDLNDGLKKTTKAKTTHTSIELQKVIYSTQESLNTYIIINFLWTHEYIWGNRDERVSKSISYQTKCQARLLRGKLIVG